MTEENWFLRLSRYADRLLDILETGRVRIEPAARRNEVLAFVRAGLADFSVSRPAARGGGWGIPVPDDPDQVDRLVHRSDGDLANGLGNLVNRTLSLVHKYRDGQLSPPSPPARPLAWPTPAPRCPAASTEPSATSTSEPPRTPCGRSWTKATDWWRPPARGSSPATARPRRGSTRC
ncbi:MAG: class I tRNA ligase family protein [Actinoplanes sp.]